MATPLTQDEKTQRGADDSGAHFRYMMEFVGFTPADANAIRQSQLVIEKYIPTIVADFYAHLLRYPPTRKFFLLEDGKVDHDYLQKRMHHLTNFWRRTASGTYDDDYARYVDYVGRAHTARGADPGIYIAERYVIGQVGFLQHGISQALEKELHGFDDDLEHRAMRAWNLLMMVILEMLSRAYGHEHEADGHGGSFLVNREAVQALAVDTYERGLGLARPVKTKELSLGPAGEIPDGERKIVEVDGVSIGVFHHKGEWRAVRNHCLHRGGPVATGCLEGDVLTCPWHGFQYNLINGQMLKDASMKLEMYPLRVEEGELTITVPERPASLAAGGFDLGKLSAFPPPEEGSSENGFPADELPEGQVRLLTVAGRAIAVYHVNGIFYATQNACTHVGGPLHEGQLEGEQIICPWHASCFNVRTGEVECGPAKAPLQTYPVTVVDGMVRVEV